MLKALGQYSFPTVLGIELRVWCLLGTSPVLLLWVVFQIGSHTNFACASLRLQFFYLHFLSSWDQTYTTTPGPKIPLLCALAVLCQFVKYLEYPLCAVPQQCQEQNRYSCCP
jgi:hypothetical protein